MKTAATTLRAIPSSRSRHFNWQFFAFWLSYFGVIVSIGYRLL
jgi:hypothetical protein